MRIVFVGGKKRLRTHSLRTYTLTHGHAHTHLHTHTHIHTHTHTHTHLHAHLNTHLYLDTYTLTHTLTHTHTHTHTQTHILNTHTHTHTHTHTRTRTRPSVISKCILNWSKGDTAKGKGQLNFRACFSVVSRCMYKLCVSPNDPTCFVLPTFLPLYVPSPPFFV
jgi:hypothetical protein